MHLSSQSGQTGDCKCKSVSSLSMRTHPIKLNEIGDVRALQHRFCSPYSLNFVDRARTTQDGAR